MGRQRHDKGSTKQVRVYGDLGEMIAEILEVETDETSASLIDPMLRPQISAMHAHLLPAILEIRKGKEAMQVARQKAEKKVPEKRLEQK